MMLSSRVEQTLEAHQTLVLATVDEAGQPEAASIFYAMQRDNGELRLICALLSRSSKLAALRRNPQAGIFIGPQAPTIWLQAECTAEIVEDAGERMRWLDQLVNSVPASRAFVERVSVTPVLFRVRRIKLTDLTGGLPPIEVVELE